MTVEVYDWRQLDSPTPAAVVPVPQAGVAAAGGTGYAQAALASELRGLLEATEGHRNDNLNEAAFSLGTLVGAGLLDEGVTQQALEEAGLAIGLGVGETLKTVRSGLSAGQRHPRQVPVLTMAPAGVGLAGLVAPVAAPGGPSAALVAPGGADTPAPGAEGAAEGRPRTSWWPQSIGLVAASAAAVQPPTHLWREDDACLFYSGKVNGLLGESESGKTWVALKAMADSLLSGERTLMLDFEDSAGGIAERLRSMGVDEDALGLLDYASPDEALGLAQSEDLSEALGERYGLIVVDGVNAGMTLLGYDLNSNTDATLFNTKLLRPLARTSACVITVDHVPKNSEARGKGGIGAQAKRAMMDGCALSVEVVEPFGKGQTGMLKLTVDKDRPGYVRGVSAYAKDAGRVRLESNGDGTVRMRVLAPDLRGAGERGPLRMTGLMEKISRYLEHTVGALATNDVVDGVASKRANVIAALGALADEGFLEVSTGPRSRKDYLSLRPYRQTEDPLSDLYDGEPLAPVPTGSHQFPPVPGNGSSTGSQFPLPRRGGTGPERLLEAVEATAEADPFPEGYGSCNGCGELTADHWLAEGQGYCAVCAKERR